IARPTPAPAAAPHPDDERIHEKLSDILARPEFDPQPAEPWFLQLLDRFFKWLGSLSGSSPSLYWLLLISCVLLLLLLLGHIAWTLYRVFYLGFHGPAESGTRDRRQRLSNEFREQARLSAERGDYTEAIRLLFLAIVFRLDESGRVLFPRSYT